MSNTITVNIRADSSGVVDKAGNTLELALANAPTYTEQSILSLTGRAIGFDSTRRYKIKRSTPIADSRLGDYTLSYWVKWNTLPSDWCVPCFNGRIGTTMYQNISIWITDFDRKLYLQCNLRDGSGAGTETPLTLIYGVPDINKWYHVCCTCKDNCIRIFINGKKMVESTTLLTKPYSYWSTAEQYFEVGGGGCERNYYLNGYLDDVFAIQGVALFTEDFTPPTTYMDITNYNSLIKHKKLCLKQY